MQSGDFGWTEVGTSGANASQTVTHAGEAGRRHAVSAITAFIRGAAAGQDILVELKEGAARRLVEVVGSGGAQGSSVGIIFPNPIRFAVGAQVDLAIQAGGAGVITEGNIMGYTVPE